jgi:hypothetical protein
MFIYIIIAFCLYFYIHFFWSQRIYTYNYFIIAIIVSFIIPAISYFQIKNKDYWFENMPLTTLSFIHLILLFFVKITYKKFNNFLIGKKLLNDFYLNKDFTYVQWDSDVVGIGPWWDEKIAKKPSWLDNIITFLLLIFPILVIIIIKKLI